MTEILLDPDILYWVVIPLFVIMVAAGLMRHSVMRLMQNDKQHTALSSQRAQNSLRHAVRLRSAVHYCFTTHQWHVRQQHAAADVLPAEAAWCEKQQEKKKSDNGDDNDPMAAIMGGGANPLSMMKGNMAFMVQNMVRLLFVVVYLVLCDLLSFLNLPRIKYNIRS